MIDKNKTRIVAVLQVVLLMSYLFTGSVDLLFILVYEFFVRLYLTALLSPIELFATGIVFLLRSKKHNRYRLDKEFAAHIALIIISFALASALLEYTRLAFAFILLLAVWKTVEAITSICLGCKLYEFLQRKGINVVSL